MIFIGVDMKLTIQNFGIIDNVEITLEGLTVIVGLNDTGKSTVGKLLFSIIKAIHRYKEDLGEDREKNIHRIVENIYFTMRRRVNFSENIDLRELFYPPKFIEDISKEGVQAIDERLFKIRNFDSFERDTLFQKIENLIAIVKQDDDKKEAIKRAFKKILFSEFLGEVFNKNTKKETMIKIEESGNLILEIKMKSFDSIVFELYDELYFNDSTIIDTPMILNFTDAIDNARSYFEVKNKNDKLSFLGQPDIAFHIKDLDSKLKANIYDDDLFNMKNFSLSANEANNLIDGEIKYISKDREFIYIKKDGKKYKIINTANGIKSFGILTILLKTGFLDERSILIIDEPEVHLHPSWQLKYAELIIILIKNGINVLVTTHSPYMLEALELFSQKHGIFKNFYFSEKQENYNTKITDINDNLEIAYQTLAEPFNSLEKISLSKEVFEW